MCQPSVSSTPSSSSSSSSSTTSTAEDEADNICKRKNDEQSKNVIMSSRRPSQSIRPCSNANNDDAGNNLQVSSPIMTSSICDPQAHHANHIYFDRNNSHKTMIMSVLLKNNREKNQNTRLKLSFTSFVSMHANHPQQFSHFRFLLMAVWLWLGVSFIITSASFVAKAAILPAPSSTPSGSASFPSSPSPVITQPDNEQHLSSRDSASAATSIASSPSSSSSITSGQPPPPPNSIHSPEHYSAFLSAYTDYQQQQQQQQNSNAVLKQLLNAYYLNQHLGTTGGHNFRAPSLLALQMPAQLQNSPESGKCFTWSA